MFPPVSCSYMFVVTCVSNKILMRLAKFGVFQVRVWTLWSDGHSHREFVLPQHPESARKNPNIWNMHHCAPYISWGCSKSTCNWNSVFQLNGTWAGSHQRPRSPQVRTKNLFCFIVFLSQRGKITCALFFLCIGGTGWRPIISLCGGFGTSSDATTASHCQAA